MRCTMHSAEPQKASCAAVSATPPGPLQPTSFVALVAAFSTLYSGPSYLPYSARVRL